MSKPITQDINSRLGIQLFLIYAVFYLGFVLVNAFAASWAEWEPIAGLNLAILWGFSLIALALILALIYGTVCVNAPTTPPSNDASLAGKEESNS
ncbi:DUF485 domain-containing protein [Aureliella helgolandensis]|uniref:Uncharacterized protein n=1 Tax=Aureliella helgolandensis TaxID=2527968 RepID=A0A518GFH7_9BACT|nr:DUF485 domain-containing protein [Aureliella helgolandensis]QDV27349.1 hypothetical protein Q31a_57370 [Aureliella helgolandensis]